MQAMSQATRVDVVEAVGDCFATGASAAVGNGVSAVEAVPAAISAFLSNLASFSDAAEFAVRMGGDTDTIASMTGALAGAHLGVDAIPAGWRDRAEGARSMGRLAGHLLDQAMEDVTAIAVEPY